MGLDPFPVWRIARIMQTELFRYFLCRLHARWNGVGMILLWEMVLCLTHLEECRWSTVWCVAGMLVVVALVFLNVSFRFVGRGRVTCRRRPWASVVSVACPVAAGSVSVVVAIGGRGSCWLLQSAAHRVAGHGVPLQAVLAVALVLFCMTVIFCVGIWPCGHE